MSTSSLDLWVILIGYLKKGSPRPAPSLDMVRVSARGAFVDILPRTACVWGKAKGLASGWTPGGAKVGGSYPNLNVPKSQHELHQTLAERQARIVMAFAVEQQEHFSCYGGHVA